jgi:hypothetical protein
VSLSNIRVMLICLVAGVLLGAAGGALFAVATERRIVYGIGVGLLIIGLIALGLGLLGATEPKEGWSLTRARDGDRPKPRRSLVARAAYEHPSLSKDVSSVSLVVWSLVVGGGLIALAVATFGIAGT